MGNAALLTVNLFLHNQLLISVQQEPLTGQIPLQMMVLTIGHVQDLQAEQMLPVLQR